jgi:disease resistance protein RPM1
MEFASVALNSLLPKLFQLLHGEYKLHKDVRKGIQFLHDELRTMHAALEKVGEVPTEQLDNLQRIWAQDVRDLSYDMEDIVDTFMVRGQGHEEHPPGERRTIESIKKVLNIVNFVTKMKTRREVAKEIKGIKERLQEVADRRDRLPTDISPYQQGF